MDAQQMSICRVGMHGPLRGWPQGLKARGVETWRVWWGFALERGFAMVVAMLGVVRAGSGVSAAGCALPGGQAARDGRGRRGLRVVIVGGGHGAWRVWVFDELDGAVARRTLPSRSNDRAYVIYTSGSTGKPKGVEVTHGNVTGAAAGNCEDLFGFDERDVWTMFHSFAFDFSVWEMWGCLLSGRAAGDRAVRHFACAG